MVFAQRIAALREYVLDGHQVTITYSFSAVSKKLKTKVNVSAETGIVPPACRNLLFNALQPVLDSMWQAVIVDRGHTFSDGHACASFWIQPCSPEDSNGIEKVLQHLAPNGSNVDSNVLDTATPADQNEVSPDKEADCVLDLAPHSSEWIPLEADYIEKTAISGWSVRVRRSSPFKYGFRKCSLTAGSLGVITKVGRKFASAEHILYIWLDDKSLHRGGHRTLEVTSESFSLFEVMPPADKMENG